MSSIRLSHSKSRALVLIPFLTMALLLAVPGHAEVISDFNDGVPDWEPGLPEWAVPGPYFDKVVFEETDGYLVMELTAGWSGVARWERSLTITDVTFGMTLTGVGEAAEITLSIWDRTPDRKLLFRQSVVDPVKPGSGSLDLPFKSFSRIFVGMHRLPGTSFPDSMAVDNLEYEFHPVSAPPTLNAERRPEGIVISWPLASSANLILEMTESLPQETWSPVAVEPIVDGDQEKVTLEPSGPSRYFRLRGP